MFIGLQQLPKPSRPVRELLPHVPSFLPLRSKRQTRCWEFSATNTPVSFAFTSICPQQPLNPVTICDGFSNLLSMRQIANPYPAAVGVARNTSSFVALIDEALSLYTIDAFTRSSICAS